ncbi:uncharacterized protein UTRI_00533_B [Ustilago trichophora]|uniref:CCHC-type domain-containing protein n=1 Tax=Ustilago trichophora TaxID=86804 RepID=A0A5C3DRS8_9BASI|nr:uncharacterized protein UTRI_00533_B [Ustilago trichophora]
MNPKEVVATATQAALSSVEQAASHAEGLTKKSSGKTQQKDASTIRDSASTSTKPSRANGAAKGGNTSAGEEGEIRGSNSDNAIDVDDDDDDDDEEEQRDYMQEGGAGEMSFVIDTAGDMDVDREIALEDEAKADGTETHVEAGLLLPTHVNVIPQADNSASHPEGSSSGIPRDMNADMPDDDDADLEGDMGDFEQLDMDPSTANRYYGAEEKAERRAKEQCVACGELGHDRRHCPHQHCLACGAMDEHPTRFCPLSTSCFRCGGMGHQTRTCPKPRRGPRSEECERCGSYSHVKALCPTLWRVYTYSTMETFDRHRAKVFFKLQSGGSARDPRRDVEPDPEELSDSEDEFVRAGEPEAPTGSAASQFDPATRWCYNCSSSGNHWGDDCPEPRVNPTRGTGEPSAFSEFVSRLGPFAKLLPGAPPLAGFQMPSSQFTFSVGSSATMHVSSDAVPSSSSGRSTPNGNNSRRSQSSRDAHNNNSSSSNGAGLSIGRHFLSSPHSSRTASPHPGSFAAGSSRNNDSERLVSFDRTKAVACEGGGFLTRKEKKKGKTPLPEHLFRQWVRDRHDYPEHADEIRAALEKRAELESKGLDIKSVPSTRDIVGEASSKRKNKDSRSSDNDRPNKKRRGGTFDDPLVIDSDPDIDTSDSDSDSDTGGGGGGRRRKRRGDGKNSNRKGRKEKDVHTGWGHNGDGGGKGGGYTGGKFAKKRNGGGGGGGGYKGKTHDRSNSGGGGGGSDGWKKRGRRGGSGGGGSKPKHNNGGGSGGGGGGDKVRGGGSKYRGGYF